MSKILIDPPSLRGGSTVADCASSALKGIGRWSAPQPQGISGRTNALIGQATAASSAASRAGADQAVYLRTTAMLAVNLDEGTSSMLPTGILSTLAPLTDPFGRDRRGPGNGTARALQKVLRNNIGINVGFGGGIVDTGRGLIELPGKVVRGEVKPNFKKAAKFALMPAPVQGFIVSKKFVTDAYGEVRKRSSKNQGSQAVGRFLWEASGLVSAAGKAGTVAKGTNVASGTSRTARIVSASGKITSPDIRTALVKGYEHRVKNNVSSAARADSSARARVQSLLVNKPPQDAPASVRASHDSDLYFAKQARESTKEALDKARAAQARAPRVTAGSELGSDLVVKAAGNGGSSGPAPKCGN